LGMIETKLGTQGQWRNFIDKANHLGMAIIMRQI